MFILFSYLDCIARENSGDPNQTAPRLIRVCTVCQQTYKTLLDSDYSNLDMEWSITKICEALKRVAFVTLETDGSNGYYMKKYLKNMMYTDVLFTIAS